MKHKMMLLALVVVSGLLYALPSMAAAEEWKIDPAPTAEKPLTFTSSGKEATLTTASGVVSCTANSGTGKYTTQTTGDTTITFTGCTTTFFGFPITCTTSGQASGTIKTTELLFHNIMIESTAQVAGGTPGILITPNAGHFATFVCGGNTVVVGGNGVIGDISTPKCGGAASTTSTLKFEASGAIQKYMQVETAGTKFDQTSSKNGGAAETASQSGEGTVTYNQAATITCP